MSYGNPTPVEILKGLEAVGFVGAQVSGGFLRDRMIGRQPKDMDVFISGYPRRSTEEMQHLLSRALGGCTVTAQFDLSYGEDSEIWRVYKTDLTVDGVEVQVIELAEGLDPTTRWRQYDFNLCQITLGVDGVVQATDAFQAGLVNKQFVLEGQMTEKEYARSLRRWERWKADVVAMGFTLVDKAERPAELPMFE